jgi:hypothetical protein
MKTFIRIDEQGWCFHFKTNYRGYFWKPSCWILSALKKSKYVDVVNTYGVADGIKVFDLHYKTLKK